MNIIEKNVKIKHKKFPCRIHFSPKAKYIFVTHHGILSKNSAFWTFENWIKNKATIISFDARVNGNNKMRASRMSTTYVRDFRDIIFWVKKEYPNIPIVTLGSSWGATIVIQYAKKYGTKHVFKNIAWSIPFNFLSNNKTENNNENDEKAKIEKKLTTKKWGYIWKFFIMLTMNINAKSYTKIDINKITKNKIIIRANRLSELQPTPVKLFWAAYKSILMSNWNLKKINKDKNKNQFLYIQSTKDSYLTQKKLKKLRQNTGYGVDVKYLDEGTHAFQWEIKNNLNHRVFEIILNWLKKNK